MMSYYLQESDYEVAEKMGIDRSTLYNRVYQYNWSILRATSTPKQKHFGPYKEYKELCDKNGISRDTFNGRLRRGYTPEEAATKAVNRGHKLHSDPKLKEHHFETAEKNGIKRETVRNRVYQWRWSIERAITEPVNTKYRRKS